MKCDLLVIGAGPAGAAIAKLVAEQGFKVIILEKSLFPRFTIGESLLPQSMQFLEQCGLLPFIPKDFFQVKKGALFARGAEKAKIDFSKKFSPGPSETWQVTRADFDQFILNGATASGVEVIFESTINNIQFPANSVEIIYEKDKKISSIESRYIVDASGNAMILPRILKTFSQPEKSNKAVFTHFKVDHRNQEESENILIAVNQKNWKVWYWGIPLKNGSISVGVVSDCENFSSDDQADLMRYLKEEPQFCRRLDFNSQSRPVQSITAYQSTVSPTHGDRYLLVGNAGGFIDPIFSSGVTLALKSVMLGAPLVIDYLKGKEICWEHFEQEMKHGNKTFRAYIEAWYETSLQQIIFTPDKTNEIEQKISSILAGYVWDRENSLVREPQRKLGQISRLLNNLETK